MEWRRRYKHLLTGLVISGIVAVAPAMPPAASQETVDLQAFTRIRDEGLRRSQVMEMAAELSDRIGARLTGSPAMREANQWTRDQLARWGLQNAHLEAWGPFGQGWTNESISVRMLSPEVAPVLAYAEAWTPGLKGTLRGRPVFAKLAAKEDLDANRGKLAGKIVLIDAVREVKPREKADSDRMTDESLAELAAYQIPSERPRPAVDPQQAARQREFRAALVKFLREEKIALVVRASAGEDGTLFVASGGSYRKSEPPSVPSIRMAIEHYGRIARLLERNVPVELEVSIANRFYDAESQWNTIAELPGSDKSDEVVMLGAHLDSWHTGTGATDNAAGVAVVMEAMRILKALDLKPRRTIRVALWSGEEEGLLGSRAYVKDHFASRPEPPAQSAQGTAPPQTPAPQTPGPLTLKPEHAKLSTYFNVDNGTGRIRGIYLQENAAARPIFQAWLEPFADLGAATCTLRSTGSTDHTSFDSVGLPGFQFIQDAVEYWSRTHHSNMDVYERLQRQDMMQNAVIVASFAYQAAMREQMIPRKPLPGATAPPPPVSSLTQGN